MISSTRKRKLWRLPNGSSSRTSGQDPTRSQWHNLTFLRSSQLLDLLLDVNESAQIPVDKRIDLTTDIPALSPIPPLVNNEDLENAAELKTPEGQALYNEIRTMISEKAASSDASKPLKSLAALIAATPHLSSNHPNLPSDLVASLEPEEGQTAPLAYLTPDQLDDYIDDIDASLGLVAPLPPQFQNTPQHELTFGNFHSPYNWLRRNVPQIFLQDGESSEKSHGKPGALRGAGKRASIPAPSKPDALEFVEEDGIGYDAALGGPVHTKGKRKREEDDGGYHPKGGRATGEGKAKKPRKKKNDETTPSTSGRKGKGRAKLSSPATDPNSFGPI
jgi:IEC3 subunit of the Ino80 complex, chromatin re-modelling